MDIEKLYIPYIAICIPIAMGLVNLVIIIKRSITIRLSDDPTRKNGSLAAVINYYNTKNQVKQAVSPADSQMKSYASKYSKKFASNETKSMRISLTSRKVKNVSSAKVDSVNKIAKVNVNCSDKSDSKKDPPPNAASIRSDDDKVIKNVGKLSVPQKVAKLTANSACKVNKTKSKVNNKLLNVSKKKLSVGQVTKRKSKN